MRISKLLAIVIVLQVLILLTQWLGGGPRASTAQAQVPDAVAQRLEIIDQLKTSNAKLDHIVSILGSGNLQVQVSRPDYISKK